MYPRGKATPNCCESQFYNNHEAFVLLRPVSYNSRSHFMIVGECIDKEHGLPSREGQTKESERYAQA